MSRLIDADLLKEHIGSYAGMFTDEGFMVNLDAVFRGIDFQPTAYDVEAVVGELWKSTNGCGEICIADAVEIVKGGRNE